LEDIVNLKKKGFRSSKNLFKKMSANESKSEAKTTVVRLRIKAKKIVQGCDEYIGRRCFMGGWRLQQSDFHNPFMAKEEGGRQQCAEKYKAYLRSNANLLRKLPSLRGKVLGCWCKPKACHGDVLVNMLNQMTDLEINALADSVSAIG
jgi:hypothetical protein